MKAVVFISLLYDRVKPYKSVWSWELVRVYVTRVVLLCYSESCVGRLVAFSESI